MTRRESTADDRRVTIAGPDPQPVWMIGVGKPRRYYRVQPAGLVLPPGDYRALLDHEHLTCTFEKEEPGGAV